MGEVYSSLALFFLLKNETDLREGTKSAIMKKIKNGIIMGFDKDFIEKAFVDGKDRVNRYIFVKPEELIEISNEDLSYFGEGIFYCLPNNQYIMDNKDEIRKKYKLSKEMPKINGIYLGTFVKMRAWEQIRKTKPSLKGIIRMIEK